MSRIKYKKGISLITLVITIVVIVMLLGGIVLSISNNNPINEAQKAVIRQDITIMIEQHNLVYATELGNANGDKTKIEDTAFVGIIPDKYKADFIANKEGIEYNCKDKIIKNIIKEMNTEKVILTCELTKPTINSVAVENITETTADITVLAVAGSEESTIVSYKYSTDNGVTYKESSRNVITITDLISGTETIVKIKVIDSNGNESIENTIPVTTKTVIQGITIPDDFYYVGGTKDTGIVISDNASDKGKGDAYEVSKTLLGNQYVWVPIAKSTEFVSKEWGKGMPLSDCHEPAMVGYSTETEEYNEMKAKVIENQGFYIARYEASNNSGTAESKALKVPWTNIQWNSNNAMDRAPVNGTASYEGRHASDKLNYKSVQSTLIYGVQWDCATKFIEKTGTNVVEATSWGNYQNATFNYTTTSNTTATKTAGNPIWIPTGATERHIKQNISDMAGNVFEWTMEAYGSINRNYRGGGYNYEGVAAPAYRFMNQPTMYLPYKGFRITLYIK